MENIADFFDLIGWETEYHAHTDLKYKTIEELEQSIIEYIDRGIPIMVDWVDWAGHWQVIIGIDTCGSGYYIFLLSRFFGMWREGPCSGKETPYSQPFVAAYPKNLKQPHEIDSKGSQTL